MQQPSRPASARRCPHAFGGRDAFEPPRRVPQRVAVDRTAYCYEFWWWNCLRHPLGSDRCELLAELSSRRTRLDFRREWDLAYLPLDHGGCVAQRGNGICPVEQHRILVGILYRATCRRCTGSPSARISPEVWTGHIDSR